VAAPPSTSETGEELYEKFLYHVEGAPGFLEEQRAKVIQLLDNHGVELVAKAWMRFMSTRDDYTAKFAAKDLSEAGLDYVLDVIKDQKHREEMRRIGAEVRDQLNRESDQIIADLRRREAEEEQYGL
jgi:hypothetical protein